MAIKSSSSVLSFSSCIFLLSSNGLLFLGIFKPWHWPNPNFLLNKHRLRSGLKNEISVTDKNHITKHSSSHTATEPCICQVLLPSTINEGGSSVKTEICYQRLYIYVHKRAQRNQLFEIMAFPDINMFVLSTALLYIPYSFPQGCVFISKMLKHFQVMSHDICRTQKYNCILLLTQAKSATEVIFWPKAVITGMTHRLLFQ